MKGTTMRSEEEIKDCSNCEYKNYHPDSNPCKKCLPNGVKFPFWVLDSSK